MKKMCMHTMGMMRHHPEHPHFPTGILVFPALMVAGSLLGVFIAKRILCTLQTIAETNALDELGDRLTDAEKAELERRIRGRLFECGTMGCCHR